ncbi:hypothetical protein OIU76_027141 [Salix suchowensis]|nr:hypothetical protein OIU76_027141 [Salix suchowensis]
MAASVFSFVYNEPINFCFIRTTLKRPKSQTKLVSVRSEKRIHNSSMATRMRLPSILATAATLAVLAASLSWASGSPEATFVKKTISSHKIVIFSKSYCPYDSLSLSLTPTHILMHGNSRST